VLQRFEGDRSVADLNDQMRRYSGKNMRSIPFSESEINSQLLPGGTSTVSLF
jgi:hypothetical protein